MVADNHNIMEFLGKIFGHHPPAENVTIPPSTQLQELLVRWRDQLSNRKPTETTLITGELLETLVNTPELLFGKLKFVREGNRVVVNIAGVEHSRIAQDGGLRTADDAGVIERDTKDVVKLIVRGDSESLGIDRFNKNRPGTLQILRKINPKIKIDLDSNKR